MNRIHAALHDAEEHWNIREELAKLQLRELKEVATTRRTWSTSTSTSTRLSSVERMLSRDLLVFRSATINAR
uniref:Uncharacterized protein n=1 Tax=Arundo donax TaxID=35708 RepID=A0A0A9A1G6_ARUDO